MKVGVIIPVVQREMYNQLMASISTNTLRPNHIVTIDNSEHGISQVCIPGIQQTVIRNKPQKDAEGNFMPGNGTNEAWKQGMEVLGQTVDIITFLNDDVILNPLFFEKTYHTMEDCPKCGFLVPSPNGDLELVKRYNRRNEPDKIHKTKERHGWAMTLRRSLLDKFPPIPNGMTIWYGDNWFADLTNMFGYYRLIRRDNPVFHYGGTSSKQEIERASQPVMSRKRRNEHDVFLRAIREYKQNKAEEELQNELKKLDARPKKPISEGTEQSDRKDESAEDQK